MVGIIIVIYKSYEQILSYIRNEVSRIRIPHKTVIVDVGAPLEGTRRIADALGIPVSEYAGDANGDMFILCSKENLGYARGNNLGAEYLLKHFPEIDKLLFSNDDIEYISPDVVEVLSKKMDQMPDVGCIGPKVVDFNGNLQGPGYTPPDIRYTIRRNMGESFFGAKHYWLDATRERKSEYVNIVSGCFHLCRASDFVKIGMFDPETFLYWEEELLSERLKQIGQRVYFESSVSIRHLLKCELFGQKLFFSKYRRVNVFLRTLLALSALCRLTLVRLALLKRRLTPSKK